MAHVALYVIIIVCKSCSTNVDPACTISSEQADDVVRYRDDPGQASASREHGAAQQAAHRAVRHRWRQTAGIQTRNRR